MDTSYSAMTIDSLARQIIKHEPGSEIGEPPSLPESLNQRRAAHRPANASIGKMYDEVIRLKNGVQALEGIRKARNPSETGAAHLKRVDAAAKKFDADIEALNDRLHGIWREGLSENENRIKSKVKLEPDSYASEIRAAFRSLESGERFKLLGALVDANRGPELAAIVKAPAVLTGVTEDLQSKYTDAIVSKHAPAEFAVERALMEAISTAALAISVAKKASLAVRDPAQMDVIAAEEAAAAKAAAEYTRVMS